MNSESRIMAIRLMDKIEKNPEYAKQIGISVTIKKNEPLSTNNGERK